MRYLLIIMMLIAGGCAPVGMPQIKTNYVDYVFSSGSALNIGSEKVSPRPTDSGLLMFDLPEMKILVTHYPTDFHLSYDVAFGVQNLSDSTIIFNWDKAVIVDFRDKVHPVALGGMKYIDMSRGASAAMLPKGATAEYVLIQADTVMFASVPGSYGSWSRVGVLPGGNTLRPDYIIEKDCSSRFIKNKDLCFKQSVANRLEAEIYMKTKGFRVVVPVTVGNETKEYEFEIKVADYRFGQM